MNEEGNCCRNTLKTWNYPSNVMRRISSGGGGGGLHPVARSDFTSKCTLPATPSPQICTVKMSRNVAAFGQYCLSCLHVLMAFPVASSHRSVNVSNGSAMSATLGMWH